MYIENITTINPVATFLSIATIIIVIYSRKITRRIPGSFIAIVLITAITHIFNLEVSTIETFFGEIPSNFNFTIPDFALSDLTNYIAPALTIALLGSIESLLSAVVSDGMISGNHRSNTELIAQGIANIVTPLFGGIPATGAIARTATNVKNGGRTPISGIVHALTLLLIMLFFGKWAKLIPMSCLAGVLIVVAYNMSEWRTFRSILKNSWFDILVLLSTFFLTVLVDLTVAIEVGVVLSAVLFMKRMSDVGQKNIGAEIDSDLIDDYSNISPKISIYEISGPLFFASAKQYAEIIKSTGIKSEILIIRMRHVPFVDTTGLQNLKSSIMALKESKVEVYLSGVNAEVKTDLDKAGITKLIGNDNIFDLFDKAVAKAGQMV
jgi:SulP family sulfate permease